jgi:TetR/AcrR family transcriptional regulator
MYENFTRIPPDAQQRILNACIEEFAMHGYADASTNTIVKNAQIPKGTLFFFFGSKKDLFLYVIDWAVASYVRNFQLKTGELPADLFERLLSIGRQRMQFAIQEPLLYRLLFNAFINLPPEVEIEMQSRFGGYSAASLQLVTKDLDRSRFREGVEIEKVMGMITLLLEGILNRSLAEFRRSSPEQSLAIVDQLNGEVQQYFEMIKGGVYRLD